MAKTEGAEPAASGTDYSATLFLPRTEFPMRAGLPAREPDWLKRWEEIDIYARQREQAQDRPLFTLHDGPPYANGNIHIGHALNKTLKDIVSRSQQMLGFNSAYVPGWDCHGLPIEWKIEEQYRAKGKDKDEVPVNEFRAECRTFASQWVDVQREEFKRLGILGDWDNPYLTMSFDAEAQIVRELFKVAESGQLYRGSKPVMWSVVERTALAEAEIEYADYESDTIWVKFPIIAHDVEASKAAVDEVIGEDRHVFDLIDSNPHLAYPGWPDFRDTADLTRASVVIWTTTPWTIPGNRAISYSRTIEYELIRVNEAPEGNWVNTGEWLIIAAPLVEETMAKAKVTAYERSRTLGPEEMASLVCAHPLRGLAGGYGFDVPLLAGEHVTADTGTGFVHTAPGHGLDDFEIWLKSGRMLAERGIDTSIPFMVDDAGFYTDAAPGFEGARVLDDSGKKGDANARVIAALAERNAMAARGRLKHQYPHSWRSKKPVIFRNTPQWFVYMDVPIKGVTGDTLRHRALKAIDATKFYPAAGQNRLRAMIADRPDWVLSRQRAWGVPIAVFVNRETGQTLIDPVVNHRIADAFEAEGADAWFTEGAAARFLGDTYSPDEWEKVEDILDVWFDSGTTHAWVLRNKQKWPNLEFPAGMYLEGSDQHRGWFHSSLLESCATNGFAPYKSVLTHGFTMDGEGRKMSKSLGNVVAPQDIIKQFGADILRLWVASVDYAEDMRLGKETVNSTVDNYRKLRNSMRWMLGNLAHYRPEEAVDFADMPELEQLMLHRLSALDRVVRDAYASFDYKRVVAVLSNLMNIELSAFYFDIRKDALYCDPLSSIKRRAALSVLDQLCSCLTAWLAPILVFTMEEVWLERNPDAGSSVHLRLFPEVPEAWRNDVLAKKWEKIREVRRVVTGALEIARRNKVIGSSLEAAPTVYISDVALADSLSDVDFAEVCITSSIQVDSTSDMPSDAFTLEDQKNVSVVFAHAKGQRCARSWKVLPEVGSDPDYPDLSPRDAEAMRERAAAGLTA